MATSYITNAALAQQITDLLNKWQVRETQMQAWMGGTATGGPYANGTYPLTDVLQNTTYQPSPAALVSGVGISSSSAAASATAAAASATTAAGSATAAAASATAAATSLTNATTQATNASGYATTAVNAKTFANTYANNSATSATAAATSATNAATSASAASASAASASGSATAAAASATAAAASAALAATFNPALYALLAGATFTGALHGTTGTFSGALAASNLSGTNTGDQNLAPYAALAGAAFTGLISAAHTGDGTLLQLMRSGTTSAQMGFGNAFAAGQFETFSIGTVPMGIGASGAAALNFYTNSVNRLSISSAGNVLIGAPSGGAALTVNDYFEVNGATAGTFATQIQATTGSGTSRGLLILGGTTNGDYCAAFDNAAGTATYLAIYGDGGVLVGSPTGGNKGPGTLNVANGIYSGGMLLSPVVCVEFVGQAAPTITASRNAGSPTIARSAAGTYTITWAPGFTPTYAVVSQGAGSATTVGIATITAALTSTTVHIVTTSISGAVADLNATFTIWAQ